MISPIERRDIVGRGYYGEGSSSRGKYEKLEESLLMKLGDVLGKYMEAGCDKACLWVIEQEV